MIVTDDDLLLNDISIRILKLYCVPTRHNEKIGINK